MSDLPDSGIPYLSENYTGPYLSDGKLQASVEFGLAEPQSKMDALSRLHDSAYAKFSDDAHRAAADSIYNAEVKKLQGLFPALAGSLVLYGNSTINSVNNLVKYASFGLPGIVYGAIKNMIDLNDKMVNGDKYRREVLDYYKTDPALLKRQVYNPTFADKKPSENQILPVFNEAPELTGPAFAFERSQPDTYSAMVTPVVNSGPIGLTNREVNETLRANARSSYDLFKRRRNHRRVYVT